MSRERLPRISDVITKKRGKEALRAHMMEFWVPRWKRKRDKMEKKNRIEDVHHYEGLLIWSEYFFELE